MKLPLSEKLNDLADACPFPLYVVGGYVRDCIAGKLRENGDVDICAPVSAEEFCAVAEKAGAVVTAVYRGTGTVKLRLGEEEYEFACFRSDEYVRGIHTPVKTFFTYDINLDARRRDFKCNAVYYEIKSRTVCDPLGGTEDIINRRITTVADADKVFGEDGLRLMRLARQSAQLGFEPSEDCIEGAKNNVPLLKDVSAERIYAELQSILHADGAYGLQGAQYRGLKLLDKIGALDIIIPELTLGRGMKQPERFHNYDVLEHSLRTVLYSDESIRLAALLHDVGKPYCMINNGSYRMHEAESARIAKEICERLKVSKKLTAETVELSALHMYDLRCDARENKIRKFIVRNNAVLEKLLYIKQADYSACKDDSSKAPCVEKWLGIYEKMRSEGAPLNLRQLKVNGAELISAGVRTEDVGKVLLRLLDDCAIEPRLNEKKALIKRALGVCCER